MLERYEHRKKVESCIWKWIQALSFTWSERVRKSKINSETKKKNEK